MGWSYDDMCEVLAKHFLADQKDVTDGEMKDLAQAIQDAVEDWFGVRAHYRGEKADP